MMTRLRLRIGLMLPVLATILGSPGCAVECKCPPDVSGLVITTDAPVTEVSLSGTACSGGRFRCIPEDFDSTIHGACDQLQIDAPAEGHCVVDLTVGGVPVRIEREMTRRPAGCCGGGIGEANHAGQIDLRMTSDGGLD